MRALLKINLKNIKYNYLEIKNKTNKKIIAVLKDNAYGHDLVHVGKLLSTLNVDMIALATFEEALTLRKNLIFTPILLFERCTYYKLILHYKITLSVTSLSHLKELADTSLPLMIHLEIETGFNRFGLEEDQIEKALSIINNSKLILKGIFTHIASSFTYENQIKTFNNVIENIPFYNKLLIHISSSSYILKQNIYENTIRIGLALYGIHNELKLKPAMSLYAPVLRCKKINVGDMVSYDNEIIKENGYVLTLGLGYGDGWKKEYKTISYYQNEYYHQVGITNMDALMIYSKKQIEDKKYIELLGEHLTIQDLCSCYNISPYDFYSSLSPRIKKEFIT